ncbi:preprotein translocase subunit YajC [candidate division KSB1 bacterium]
MIYSVMAWLAPSGQGGGSALLNMVPLFAILVIFYFLMIRPQIKKQKKHQEMLSEIKKGDAVVAAGGIFGTVSGFKEKDNVVILKVDDNVKIEVLKTSVSSVIRKE